ncbi:MAG: serine/threonine-protein kinase, partial [Bacillota bacterium]|nr:serine/threonine-protein kinase [Bacillota bacterium]
MKYDELFDGRYRIIRPLGQGGMSTVYLAENVKLGTLWAIKEVNKNSKIDILIEPNILKKLNHKALPRIFDILEDNENIYIIVDYLDGTPLDVELSRVGCFPEDVVVDFALQICDVLSYLHSQKPNPIIYRDMKPSNIILSKDGFIKLIDFGIAREFKEEANFDTVYIGTRGYAAPEQYGAFQTNERTDIYSLGVTLYHLLTGKSPKDPPYEIKPVRIFNGSLSEGIDSIISKCTRQDPNERYSSIHELAKDLKKVQSGKEANNDNEANNDRWKKSYNGPVSFKKLILSVVGNSEFAAELGYIVTKLTDFKTLIINLDFTASKVDLSLNLVPKIDKYVSARNESFGFNMIMDAMSRKAFNCDILEKACIRSSDFNNLYVLTDPFDITNYEKYTAMDLSSVLECGYRGFDITILCLSDSILDSYSKTALERADYNIVPILANIDEIRKYEAYFQYMKEKNLIPDEKIRLIAYDYKKGINLQENL